MKAPRLITTALLTLAGCGLSSQAQAWSAMTYQQALTQCNYGSQHACAVAYQYLQAARTNAGHGLSPADAWVGTDELSHGGLRGVRPGVFSTYDFVR